MMLCRMYACLHQSDASCSLLQGLFGEGDDVLTGTVSSLTDGEGALEIFVYKGTSSGIVSVFDELCMPVVCRDAANRC